MKKLSAALAGAALSGVMAFSISTPAFAQDGAAGRTAQPAAVSAVTADDGDTGADDGSGLDAVSRAAKLNRLHELTGQNTINSIWARAYDDAKHGKDPYKFNWNSDGCTNASDSPLGFHFGFACRHHDFGYRNYKAMNAFTEGAKKRVDDTFLDDMQFVCRTQWGPIPQTQRDACLVVAKKYYQAVRTMGHL
ncbi:hypothetical protein GCM10010218_40490 [Streptomyces mashuensis]|uniref:Phospholipase A2 n=1 Tax=Streptomyces mashuensis TaxID=33904 RepID=A0A919B5N0_9ACTN|nr:phospholipase [Streptomyces mashuensis]GHF55033.1 hypothetical protein GCM10010218_40490 [Streptomyces mashuensis]